MVHVQPLPPSRCRVTVRPLPSILISKLSPAQAVFPLHSAVTPLVPHPAGRQMASGPADWEERAQEARCLEPAGPCDSEVLRAARTDGVGTLRARFLAPTTRRSSPRGTPPPGVPRPVGDYHLGWGRAPAVPLLSTPLHSRRRPPPPALTLGPLLSSASQTAPSGGVYPLPGNPGRAGDAGPRGGERERVTFPFRPAGGAAAPCSLFWRSGG